MGEPNRGQPTARTHRIVKAFPAGNNKVYEDTSFVSGDSPVVLDVNTDLGRDGVDGTIINDGPGDFTVEISNDGTNYGDAITIETQESIDIEDIQVNKIRITWVADSAYRVIII